MENYYTENRKFYLAQIDLKEIVAHLENNYADHGPISLSSYEEASTWHQLILANAGDICANYIAARAPAVDEKGASFNDGAVCWAPETHESMQLLAQAGYMGGVIERKYGGLGLPVTVNTLIVEMVSQADASLMNIFGLQDIGVTIAKFCSQKQKERVLPKFCRGEVSGAMALTEPEAGSDLQAVKLKAVEKDGRWYLDGVKRFITNGCGDVSLVLARSEETAKGAKGLSMFLYERYKDDNMIVRRIENKHGIHGSPTCEMQFNMAQAELVGKRRFGLIRYVRSLMDGARLAVSAQALGIAQAAFDEAVKYANEREQFERAIVHFPALYQMLKKMQAEIETSRLLLYHTAYHVDRLDMLENRERTGEKVRQKLKMAAAMAGLLTPLTKFTTTEMANKTAYDAVQIHGGCGFMKDFPVERLARDARITNIYEGTTQLQVVAAMGGITTELLKSEWETLRDIPLCDLTGEKKAILEYMERYSRILSLVKAQKSKEFTDYVANYLVELTSIIHRLYLFLPVAQEHAHKRDLFLFYLTESETRINYLIKTIEILADRYGENIAMLKTDFVKEK
jgi:alkylation response protein AidB-like acyl-CoA dehydrogenase